MAKPILDEELWSIIELLLPSPKPRRFGYPGRKPVGNRQALTGILFVLKTGISWNQLPREMGCGSGMTCLRRLHQWSSPVAASGNMGTTASTSAFRITARGQAGLVASHFGQLLGASNTRR